MDFDAEDSGFLDSDESVGDSRGGELPVDEGPSLQRGLFQQMNRNYNNAA